MQIRYKQERTGILDTLKVLEANRIANELEKYDGPTKRAAEIVQFVYKARSEGKSTYQIKTEGYDFVLNHSFLALDDCRTPAQCLKCKEDCRAEYEEQRKLAELEFLGNATECIVGPIGAMIRVPHPAVVVGGVAVQLGCLGWDGFMFSRKISNAKSARDRCVDKCKPPMPE